MVVNAPALWRSNKQRTKAEMSAYHETELQAWHRQRTHRLEKCECCTFSLGYATLDECANEYQFRLVNVVQLLHALTRVRSVLGFEHSGLLQLLREYRSRRATLAQRWRCRNVAMSSRCRSKGEVVSRRGRGGVVGRST